MMRTAKQRRVLRRVQVCVLVLLAVVGSGCLVNQGDLWPQDKLPAGYTPAVGSVSRDIRYGPDPAHVLDVWRPAGPQVGTIVYWHSGGWSSGSKAEIAPFVLAELDHGWCIVSAEHRLTTTEADSPRATELNQDVNRAFRYVRAHGTELGIDTSTLVAAGTSSGGYLAAMLGANPTGFTPPDLPSELGQVSPVPDAVVDLVGPTDMETLWMAGGWAPSLSECLLGCVLPGQVSAYGSPVCSTAYAKWMSPAFWVALTPLLGGHAVPAYLGFGGLDTLVRPDTQGRPAARYWESAAGFLSAWYDEPPAAGHNLDEYLNRTAFDIFLDDVRARSL